MAARAFSSAELTLAALLAFGAELGLFTLFVLAGQNDSAVRQHEPPALREIPIAVTPVLDELPLLKLGGKKMKPKLPDMWKKNPPVKRVEEASAPSTLAEKTPEAIPTSKLVERDAEAPAPDADIAKQVDDVLPDGGPDAEVTVEGPGAPGGVKEGTETDPLKARQVSAYLVTLTRWFQNRFTSPDLPEDQREGVRARVQVTIGPNRSVGSWQLVSPSGNATFDEAVKRTMDGTAGSTLPRPPEALGDVTGTIVMPIFQPPKPQNP